jgi:hypothetical protein
MCLKGITEGGIKRIANSLGSKWASKKKAQAMVGDVGMDAFCMAYAAAAIWSSSTDEEDLDEYGIYDLAPETAQQMMDDCVKFQSENADLLENAYEATGNDEEQAGHDLWLTRAGHGAGFWDGDWDAAYDYGTPLTEAAEAMGQVEGIYVGDDGMLYVV